MSDLVAKTNGGHVAPFVDLDAVIEDSIYVVLHGKRLTVKPLELESFLKLANSYEQMHVRNVQGDVSKEELIRSYYDLFHILCDEITYEDVADMTQAQCAALMAIVIDKITGKINSSNPEYATFVAETVKKKT